MRKLYLLILPIFLLQGCISDGKEAVEELAVVAGAATASHFISTDEAVRELYSLLDEINAGTRAVGSKTIKGIEGVGIGPAGSVTRSDAGAEGTDAPAIYVVNFEEGGFAVLAADDRLDPVIALADSGTLSGDHFSGTGGADDGEQSITLEDLYDPVEDEYMVGDNEYNIVTGLILRYASNGLGGDDSEQDIDLTEDYRYITDWLVGENITPMLTTKWDQGPPFNNLVKKSSNSDYPNGRASAGCVPMALMQIIAYHETPSPGDLCSHTSVSWQELKQSLPIIEPHQDSTYRLSLWDAAAHIAYNIGNYCSTNYNFYDGQSFTYPYRAANFLKSSKVGYSANKYSGYKQDKILEDLRLGRPVFIAALSGAVKGHAWVIDGYLYRYKNKLWVYNGTTTIEYHGIQKQKLVHCNWGWSGSCDGYYTSGVFDLNDGAVLLAEGEWGGTKNRDYDWWFRIITSHP